MNTNSINALELFLNMMILPVLQSFVAFAWGAGDPFWLACLKRVFLLLPVLALIVGYWTSVIGLLTVVIRSERRLFVNTLFVTWWDLLKSILSFWGGIFKFFASAVISLFYLVRMTVVGVWVAFQDIVLIPFRVTVGIAQNVLNPGVAWIAVALTMVWCVFEAVVFTYVTSPLVIDTMSNMTGNQLSENFIRAPLFLFMLFIVLGSYSVLSTWSEAVRNRNIPAIIKIGAIEAVAIFVEVIFLYREFVDALVPWFAQHSSKDFQLGVFGTLAIATLTWLGIRSMSWFLFASSGTPTIMAIIQGTGLQRSKSEPEHALKKSFQLTVNLITQIKAESEWIQRRQEELLGAFLLPPLQVIAAALNFCSFLMTTQHLFELPFRSVKDLKDSKMLIRDFDPGARKKAS